MLKTTDKEKLGGSELGFAFARRESAVHCELDHPNIIKAYHYAQSDKFFMLFMEYAGFGSTYLSRRVFGKNRPIKERRLAVWAEDIIKGIWYLH